MAKATFEIPTGFDPEVIERWLPEGEVIHRSWDEQFDKLLVCVKDTDGLYNLLRFFHVGSKTVLSMDLVDMTADETIKFLLDSQ